MDDTTTPRTTEDPAGAESAPPMMRSLIYRLEWSWVCVCDLDNNNSRGSSGLTGSGRTLTTTCTVLSNAATADIRMIRWLVGSCDVGGVVVKDE